MPWRRAAAVAGTGGGGGRASDGAVAGGSGPGPGPGALGRRAAAGAGGAEPAAVGAGQPLLRPGRHLLLQAGAVERAAGPAAQVGAGLRGGDGGGRAPGVFP